MQPLYQITVHPLDFSRFGKNPAGRPLYRIVWSDTRLMVVRHDGKQHEIPMYSHLAGRWIMERWLPAESVMGMNRAVFEAFVADNNLPEMPYPVDGEYEFVMAFPQEVVPSAAETVIRRLEYQRNNFTLKDRKLIHEQNAVAETKVKDEQKTKILEEAMERTHVDS